jgi:hypothetical protein
VGKTERYKNAKGMEKGRNSDKISSLKFTSSIKNEDLVANIGQTFKIKGLSYGDTRTWRWAGWRG